MKTSTKLKICNLALIPAGLLILLSGIQLEILSGSSIPWIWVHIAVGISFIALCARHIYLHFRKSNWFARFRKQKSPVTKVLWWLGLLTLLTGLIATIHWFADPVHSGIGAVHGKIGFLMIIVAAGHAIKRHKFYTRLKPSSSKSRNV